ncbi:hypothetical protein JB92DRAFT_2920182 [Gautieria morchelliformis]|nr:hypothetical protein JB92DRAFT_2920182 [Gautieria morchelliformis]
MDNQLQVNLRIEGALHTIFEGPVVTRVHNVTTHSSNGTHHCDGTNHGAHPNPGPTATGALDDANATSAFGWDAQFNPGFDDFFITSIGDSSNVACQS